MKKLYTFIFLFILFFIHVKFEIIALAPSLCDAHCITRSGKWMDALVDRVHRELIFLDRGFIAAQVRDKHLIYIVINQMRSERYFTGKMK